MKLEAIAAFADNYIWILHDGRNALVVDPGDAQPVLKFLADHSLQLSGILVTHHHADHVGGLKELLPVLQGPIFAPALETMPVDCTPCHGGEQVELLGLKFEVMDVPGHTAGHIAFFLPEPEDDSAPILFCGDTLFSGGCGRLFEGTPAQMHASLQRLAALPAATRVCCTHEYTLSNLRFARAVEPDNAELMRYQAWCETQRGQNLSTLPSTLELELQINPFLRCDHATVARAVASAQAAPDVAQASNAPHSTSAIDTAERAVEVFARLRQWKNEFR
ncbi:hydroxyacylglutathione hydrolase [Paucibacter sp. Y2R2-4]|uniref:hydroxyacylglutathione hydrolase n=1 Tax=Paucibacter sp. Y2R2-4 TaxID=2893553 RepID=UPI0021E4C80D|nr:hydroxyacylglutathione hydrolase [Paucibacter sp. Y2R2-4]MCV2351933.1 hydroxyacylglutathione hydrolase [Paucibacter sp. Y2R2-4]